MQLWAVCFVASPTPILDGHIHAMTETSRLLRLPPVVVTAILLCLAGCDGGATISSPFSVQQPAQTQQQTTASDEPANVTEVAVQPGIAAQQQPEEQTPTQNDQPIEQETYTLTAETPLPAAANPNPTPADITDLVLVTGQSNALGADTAFDPSRDGTHNRVFAYTDSGWQVADLHQIWDQGWFPRGDTATGPSNNLSLHFGKQVALRDDRRVVGFVLVTAPGQPISHWQPDGAFFNSIRDRVSRAINELPSKSTIDGILWHQGESDGEDDPAYGNALYTLIEAFRSESWYGEGRPFICGETASLPVNAQLNRLNSDGNPNTACVAAEGLETRGDDAHFSAEALRTIGRRYADRYIEMTQ